MVDMHGRENHTSLEDNTVGQFVTTAECVSIFDNYFAWLHFKGISVLAVSLVAAALHVVDDDRGSASLGALDIVGQLSTATAEAFSRVSTLAMFPSAEKNK